MLSEYFKPLTPGLLGFVIIFFLFLDALGIFVDKRLIKSPQFLRPVIWFFGLGVVVIVSFFVHFFFPLRSLPIFLALITLAVISVPSYIKNKNWLELFVFIKSNAFLLIPLAIFLPILFVKSSLPPYTTDEMAYHFMSPFEANHVTWTQPKDFKTGLWIFNDRFYPNLPKEMDLFLNIPFALTKTFAPARLLHFMILYSGIWSIYAWFKSRSNLRAAAIFSLLYLFLHHDMLIMATSGYIDYSTASLTALGIVTLIEYFLSTNPGVLMASFAFWGLTIGSKLPGLAPFVVSMTLLSGWGIINRHKQLLSKALILRIIFILVLFGGFWYIKTWIYTGNPLYPFLSNVFKCRFNNCYSTEGFFGSWTTPLTLSNLPQIVISATRGNSILVALMIPAALILIIGRKPQLTRIATFLLLSGTIVFPIIKLFSGFVDRYFYFLQIILTLVLALPFAIKLKSPTGKVLLISYKIILLSFLIGKLSSTTKTIYSTRFYVSPQEINFAFGKTNIFDWLKDRHRHNGDLFAWCGTPGEKELELIDEWLIHDPDESPGQIFNVNCKLIATEFTGSTPIEAFNLMVKQNKKLYLADRKACRDRYNLSITREENRVIFREEVRNLLVCNSTPVVKNVYLFDPQKINNSVSYKL